MKKTDSTVNKILNSVEFEIAGWVISKAKSLTRIGTAGMLCSDLGGGEGLKGAELEKKIIELFDVYRFGMF